MVARAIPSRDELLDILDEVKDPEVPVISVVELGIVRDVEASERGVVVTITPTYSGLSGDARDRARHSRRARGARDSVRSSCGRPTRRRGPPTGSPPRRARSSRRTASLRRGPRTRPASSSHFDWRVCAVPTARRRIPSRRARSARRRAKRFGFVASAASRSRNSRRSELASCRIAEFSLVTQLPIPRFAPDDSITNRERVTCIRVRRTRCTDGPLHL